MAIETERKFLVKNDDFLSASVGHARIAQGYLSTDPARTVRVRIKGEKAFLTLKGASDPSGVSRGEWEYGIPVEDARELLALCGEKIIDKARYDVPVGNGQHFTVDVFYGQNEGLVLAEIELSRPDEPFERPDWLGEEVTGDPRYYNSALIACPYKEWK